MKAEELRIGNYFNVPNLDQCPFRVDTIELLNSGYGKFGMYKEGYEELHPLTWYLSDLEPIPLTEEWLLKLGFEKGRKYYSFNGFDVDNKGWIGFNSMVADCKVQYVHQLQNLYFALTGEELEEKP